MYAILSVRPKYCEAIANGSKLYEFRKRVFSTEVEKVYVYSTSPVMRIVGKFSAGRIVSGSPDSVWTRCRRHAGIGESEFRRYFESSEVAYAIHIDDYQSMVPVDPWEVIPSFCPPQSYCYVEKPIKSTADGV